MRAAAALVAFLAFAPVTYAAADERCGIPDALADPQAPLTHTARKLKESQRLDILVLSGAPSQTGTIKGLRSYPLFLQTALRERLPGVDLHVTVRAAARRTVIELVPQLGALLTEVKPTLVVWQAGTVETFRGTDTDLFLDSLEDGIEEIARAGADVMLMDMQYSPRTSVLVDAYPYLDTLRRVAETNDIPLFKRYEIMRYWSETGAFDLSSLRTEGIFEQVHRCIGRLLADYVIRGAAIAEKRSGAR